MAAARRPGRKLVNVGVPDDVIAWGRRRSGLTWPQAWIREFLVRVSALDEGRVPGRDPQQIALELLLDQNPPAEALEPPAGNGAAPAGPPALVLDQPARWQALGVREDALLWNLGLRPALRAYIASHGSEDAALDYLEGEVAAGGLRVPIVPYLCAWYRDSRAEGLIP